MGDTVSFSVTATGAAPLAYSWHLFGGWTSLPPGSFAAADKTQSTLTLSNVQIADNGNINVSVSNAEGSVSSAFANLSVYGFLDQPQSVTAPPGVTIVLVGDAVGASSLQWYKDSTPISGATSSALTLANLQAGDAGSYYVEATTPVGLIDTSAAVVTVSTLAPFAGGDGTPGNPYQIATPAQLDAVRGQLGSSFILTADIDLTGYTFFPIGDVNTPFDGTFDGQGHTISNWHYNENVYRHAGFNIPMLRVGLFRSIGADGTVANLNLNACTVTTYEYGALLCGQNYGTISGCSARGYLSNGVVGGIAAENFGTISGSRSSVGAYSSHWDSYTRDTASAGGLVARNEGTISDCWSEGPVWAYGTAGGLVSFNAGQVNRSYATGVVRAQNYGAGGLVGQSPGGIDQCFATGHVDGWNEYRVGGLVGAGEQYISNYPYRWPAGTITNSYATGNVTGEYFSGLPYSMAGLIGYGATFVQNCYSTGAVTPSGYTGSYFPNWQSVYRLSEVSSGNDFGQPVTSAQLQDQTTFVDWDFTNIWTIQPGSYPSLLNVSFATLTGISPQSVIAPSTDITLTVTGSGFLPGAQVEWNGSARPTTLVDSTTLTAIIPSADLQVNGGIGSATVDVLSPNGARTRGAAFLITTDAVTASQTAAPIQGEPATVTTVTDGAGSGVSATFQGTGAVPAAVTVANYSSTSTPYFDVGGAYMDVQVVNAAANDSMTVSFYYPATITGQTEADLQLLYYNGSQWLPVLSAFSSPPAKDTTDGLDGTSSGGRFTVTFNNTSQPKITELTGTMFTESVPDRIPPTIKSITATPNVLSPPNHKLVPVTISVNAVDDTDPHPKAKITGITANEPINGKGDGNTAVDYEITGDLTLNLRAERSGKGKGRVYTITVEVKDQSGNKSTGTVNVTVPKG